MFRLFGLLAALNLRLHRIRINFVPLNLAVAGLLLAGATAGLTRVVQGSTEAQPQPVTLADLAAGRVAAGSFVRVDGLLDVFPVLEVGPKGYDGKLQYVRERFRLLHDGGSEAVWIDAASIPLPGTRGTFVGFVRPLPDLVRNATAAKGANLTNRAPSNAVTLHDGQRPRTFGSGLLLLTTCTPPLALLAWVWIRRSHFFRAGDHVPAQPDNPYEPIDMRVSARLRLTHRTSRRFVEVGAALQRLEGGGLAVVADIDASSYVMGMRAISREGTWALVMPANAVLSIVAGEVASGWAIRPAARIDVLVGGRVTDRLTLSFASVGQRQRVLRALHATIETHQPVAA